MFHGPSIIVENEAKPSMLEAIFKSPKAQDDTTVALAAAACLISIILLYFFLTVFDPPSISVKEAQALKEGAKVSLLAKVSKVSTDRYGSKTGELCDSSGCMKAGFSRVQNPELYSLDWPVKVSGTVDLVGFEKRLVVQEMEI
ncbi:hypothetical protein FJZ26_00645 [Candidatus Parvarchaeota archaeon]|nr:hypothetical protein [Candidatus Parvarchaeota archaeon]